MLCSIIILVLYMMLFIESYMGSGALCGKMLLVRIIENNEIDAYFRPG